MRNVVGDAEPRESRTEGHHGNPIIVLEASVDDQEAIEDFFHRLEPALKADLVATLDRRIDDGCNLFIKLDKQTAFLGKIQMATNDDVVSVRLKVYAFPAKCAVAQRMVEEYLASGH